MSPTADSGQPTVDDAATGDHRTTAAEELPRPVLVGTHVALRLARTRV